MYMRKVLLAVGAAALTIGAAGNARAATISTDIVIMVDESGSMGTVQANLRNNIGLFAAILSAGGVDARYALVGYGNSAVVPRLLTNFTDAASFAAAAQNLQVSGGTEPGYDAVHFGLNNYPGQTNLSYRPNAVKNLILFTDEPDNGGLASITLANTQALLTANNALFNAVLDGANTISSYSALATDHHGGVFALNSLNTANQTAVQGFVTAVATAKLQETIDFCAANPNAPECQSVPEPGTLALLGVGMAFAARRRIRRAA
jgi:hypothetical protein